MAKLLISSLPQFFMLQIPFLLASNICQLLQPMILKKFVAYLETPERNWGGGLGIVLILFLVSAIQSACTSRFSYYSGKAGLQYRSSVNAIIFEKCFMLSNKSSARPDMNPGRIINMVGTDSERAFFFMMFCMQIWSAPLVFIVSLIMLWQLVGWCTILAIVAFLCALPINAFLMNKQVSARRSIMKASDARIKATNEFFSGIRITKFMTWEPKFIAGIEQKRQIELDYLKTIQTCRIYISFLNTATPLIMIAAVFVVYHYTSGEELTPSVVFPTIALLGIIRQPFTTIPWVFTMMVQFLISMTRICTFLECENACDTIGDIEELYRKSSKSVTICKAAVLFENLDVTAYVPVKLPTIAKLKLGFVSNILKKFCCCQSCSANAHPTPSSLEEESEHTSGDNGPTEDGQGHKPKNENVFYELTPKVLLKDLNLEIPRGKLTVIVGPTGSGKSSLFLTMLSQLEVSKGEAWCCKNIAYVPQQPWIMNATLKDNILFFSEDDEERLTRALEVSQLKADLDILSNGLKTEIGEKGINLSGGQKARVNLARAVYADREMYILDDPLSALDAHVGERVVDDCFLGALSGKTRVLATHQMHVVPKADYIIALGEEKQTVFAGDAESFMKTNIYRTMSQQLEEENETSMKELETEDSLDFPADEKSPKKPTVKEEPAKAQNDDEEEDHLIVAEEKARGAVPFSIYTSYFDYCGGRNVLITVVCIFTLTELLSVAPTVWLSLWSTNYLKKSTELYVTVYIILVLLATSSIPLRYTVLYEAMRKASREMHKTLLRSVAVGTMEFFDRTPLGRLMNRFSSDIDAVDNKLQMSMVTVLEFMYSMLSSILIAAVSQPLIIVALVPTCLVNYKLIVFYNAANREIRRTMSIMKSPVFSILGEITSGMATVSAYGRRNVVMREALRRLDVVYSCGILQNCTNLWMTVRLELLSNTIITCIALGGVIGSHDQYVTHRCRIGFSVSHHGDANNIPNECTRPLLGQLGGRYELR
ncbi:ABC transporter transmembrane region/ABC transporter, putative [Angomonas deanei]|uniref:ABC transporter transmembrane region/ABC transporter, putative n=1 Tax=Angomonas deanei TaxID=59799 RepID=A0A7G2CH19_9TRYP|nr:ABC transporter transmembrane region/ABC transporter, putative [Angomonas deanei]